MEMEGDLTSTWPKLISFPFPEWVTISAKGQKPGLFLSCLQSLLPPSPDGGGECLCAPFESHHACLAASWLCVSLQHAAYTSSRR